MKLTMVKGHVAYNNFTNLKGTSFFFSFTKKNAFSSGYSIGSYGKEIIRATKTAVKNLQSAPRKNPESIARVLCLTGSQRH